MFPISHFQSLPTPFYFYDLALLRSTLSAMKQSADSAWQLHYAVKANPIKEILTQIKQAGLGADCVSGGEVRAALEAGIDPGKIVLAGVAKSDWEIRLALDAGIFCFNVESIEELEIINNLAMEHGKTARICLRINPDIDAHTNKYITTGLKENKFGIQMSDMLRAVDTCRRYSNLEFIGLHFHIGSQITIMEPFRELCLRINSLVAKVEATGANVRHINVGGGLGVSYTDPDGEAIPDFDSYFSVFRDTLDLSGGKILHFELGRAVVAQCGSLITRVLYVKHGRERNFVMVDAGMTDLIRPALYDAFHRIDNLSAHPDNQSVIYDVVGPICESSDVFVKDYGMAPTSRGDILAIRSAGAYGEIMASQYNLRRLPGHIAFH